MCDLFSLQFNIWLDFVQNVKDIKKEKQRKVCAWERERQRQSEKKVASAVNNLVLEYSGWKGTIDHVYPCLLQMNNVRCLRTHWMRMSDKANEWCQHRLCISENFMLIKCNSKKNIPKIEMIQLHNKMDKNKYGLICQILVCYSKFNCNCLCFSLY